MLVRQRITFICNGCGQEWMITEEMEMPPYWLGLEVAVADKDGLVPEHERAKFIHFCEQECLTKYTNSDELKERILSVDRNIDEVPPEKADSEE